MAIGRGLAYGVIRVVAAGLLISSMAFACNVAGAATANNFGIVSGNPSAATANTSKLRSLVSPVANGGAGTFVGDLTFPDGATYYFNDVIPIRDGIAFDLMARVSDFNLKGYRQSQPGWIADRISALSLAIEASRMISGDTPCFSRLRRLICSSEEGQRFTAHLQALTIRGNFGFSDLERASWAQN